jgi:hypothetical protein
MPWALRISHQLPRPHPIRSTPPRLQRRIGVRMRLNRARPRIHIIHRFLRICGTLRDVVR